MNIKAVVFDLDGLMIDSERLVQKTWNIAEKRWDMASWVNIFITP